MRRSLFSRLIRLEASQATADPGEPTLEKWKAYYSSGGTVTEGLSAAWIALTEARLAEASETMQMFEDD